MPLLLALLLFLSAVCQPAFGSVTPTVIPIGETRDNTSIGLFNTLDVTDNLFVPHKAKFSQENFIIVIWTDKKRLKAMNLLEIRGPEQVVNVTGFPVKDYQNTGRDVLVKMVEETVGVKVDYYIQVDQAVFEKTGEMIGPINLSGRAVAVAAAFEESPLTQDIGCEKIIRSLAQKMAEPETLVKLPLLAYVLATEVETNMGVMDILRLYRQVHGCGADNIHRL